MRSSKRSFGRKQRVRRSGIFEPVQRFLIVCEGIKTEPYYFQGFRVPKDIRAIEIKGVGDNTINLVRKAIELKSQKEYDQVWCVFDVEDFPQDNIRRAVDLANQNSICIACSNQAFEIWYLLHFHYYNSALSRNEYEQRLSELLGHPYDKCSRTIYSELVHLQAQAILNARRLLAQYEPYDASCNNPSTEVHLLVDELNRFTPERRASVLRN